MKTRFLVSPLVVCGLFASAATFASIAQASAPEQTAVYEEFEFRFIYNPADLESDKGANKLLSRLRNEVRSHCGVEGRMSAGEKRVAYECVDRTMGNAINKFGSSTLTQAYQSRVAG